ncbi:hypothetical protein LY632_07800 [Erythrobacter sp. SDW2]|uniref:hypothetical protein n=1 Tax=Erythrobacter sp. SDW2 TaxID=2907154 RepID=UPI001F225DDE|nr:hypothetical protein [Erythrobacter sp. SDW2]UIP05621.1 hypothetical protein LY632_07800 [Erythrobacter sp. SDW2]
MSDHPTAFGDAPVSTDAIEWNDGASLHTVDDGQGVLDGAKALRRGTFAEMIRHLMQLPVDTRGRYQIQKAGDRAYSAAEAEALAKHSDFPVT